MNDNIVTLAPAGKDAAIPESSYVVVDVNGEEHYADGFLVFTSAHIAVMREIPGLGALPVLVLPLPMVKKAELLEDDDEEDAPF